MSTEPTPYSFPPLPALSSGEADAAYEVAFAPMLHDDIDRLRGEDIGFRNAIPLLEWRPLDQKADPSELTSEGRCLWITAEGEWCFCSPSTMAGYHPHKDRAGATPAWWLPMDSLLALPRQAPAIPPTPEEACLAEFYAHFEAKYPEFDSSTDYAQGAKEAWMAARGMNGGAA